MELMMIINCSCDLSLHFSPRKREVRLGFKVCQGWFYVVHGELLWLVFAAELGCRGGNPSLEKAQKYRFKRWVQEKMISLKKGVVVIVCVSTITLLVLLLMLVMFGIPSENFVETVI